METLREKFLHMLQTGSDDVSEMEVRPHGGPDRAWMLTRSNRIFIDGKPCIVSIGIDITERKKLEKALEHSKAQLNLSLQAAHAGTWEWHPSTHKVDWSEEIWQLYGIDPSGKKPDMTWFVQALHPEDRKTVPQRIRDAAVNGQPIDFEYRVIQPDGSVRWVMSRGKKLDEHRYIGTIIDITERKLLEQELTEKQRRIGMSLEAARAGIWEWDLQTGENEWSDEIWPIYGLEKENKRPSFELWACTIHPDDRQQTIDEVTKATDLKIELNVEYRILHLDGSIRWLMSRGMPAFDDEGRVVRYTGTIIDITERKLLEQKLLESKFRYSYALDAAHAGIWEWNLKSDELAWSEQVWRLYGLEPDSVRLDNQLCVTTVHPDDREEASGIIRNAVANRQSASLEYRTVHPDGTVHWLSSRGMPLRNADGEVTRHIGTIIDITERKRMEETLRKNQAKFNFILEKSRLGVWDLEVGSGRVLRTKEHAGIFGYDTLEDNWTMPKFLEHIVPEDRERVETVIRKAFESNESYTFECRIRSVQGKIRWIWVFGAFEIGPDGKAEHVSGIVQDVTERKRTELLLKENELKFRNIFEFSPVAIGIANASDNCLFDVNASWLRLFGQSKEKIIGHCLADLDIYADRADHEMILHSLQEHDRVVNTPLRLRKSDGEPLNVLLSAEYITFHGATNLLLMMTDITIQELQQASISQLEQAVAERTDRLRQEVERQQRFLNMISHEYRTPLAIIRGNLDLIDLKHQSGNFSNTREMLKIKRAIDRLVEMMEVSIQESRILESKKTDMATNLSLEPLIASQLETFRSMWPERQVLHTEMPDAAVVQGEAAQLKITLFNLLDNARKYSPKGSPIEVRGNIENGMAVVTIRNEGNGLTKEDEEACFEKYRRGSNAANTAGAGLGLWLVRDIIDQHGGHITLAGIGSGVEATIWLPLAEGLADGPEPDIAVFS
jgi:PAS domain S-box-containing protein